MEKNRRIPPSGMEHTSPTRSENHNQAPDQNWENSSASSSFYK